MATCRIESEVNKHPHADMIIAKVLNMDLVVFVENDNGWSGKEDPTNIQFHEYFEYFLCLPKHAEAVLHSLDGGKVEVSAPDDDEFYDASAKNWNPSLWCMQENWDSRIVEEEPEQKVKRWVGLHESGVTCGPIFGKEMPKPVPNCGWSFIEDAEK